MDRLICCPVQATLFIISISAYYFLYFILVHAIIEIICSKRKYLSKYSKIFSINRKNFKSISSSKKAQRWNENKCSIEEHHYAFALSRRICIKPCHVEENTKALYY